jgi:hypothetical protein
MVSREDDRILYDHSVDEIEAGPRGPFAVGLVVLVHVAAIVYVSWTTPDSASKEGASAYATSEPIAAARAGFDASSSEFKTSDPTGQARPDFSIVVAGASAADGRQVGSRAVQFVVVDGIDDLRPEWDVQARLCARCRT